MIGAVDGLIEELRRVGIPVSVAEKVDAAAALKLVDVGDRTAVKTGLAATLVKDAMHQSAFDAIFDLYFGLQSRALPVGGDELPEAGDGADDSASGDGDSGDSNAIHGSGAGGGGLSDLDDASIRELVINVVEGGDVEGLLARLLAAELVTRHAGIQPGRAVAGTYYLYRTMRAVGSDNILATVVEHAEQAAPGGLDKLTRRLLAEDVERRIHLFQQEIESEIRRRLVADRGADAVAKTLRTPLPEDVDFLTASGAQLSALSDVLQPLSRKLAARVSQRRRRHKRGGIDFRRTIRTSLSTGGSPLRVHFHKPKPAKPELVVLADISGSVSAFAAFTLQLAYALRSQFAKVRCFVFVDGLDEVTELISTSKDILAVTAEINSKGLGVWLDGRSDYGNAIQTFWDGHGGELRHRSTVLILGDARTNYHASRAKTLERIAGRAGHVFWLNPEPEVSWDSGDSVISQYAPYCDGVFEARNLRQLRTFIEKLD